MQYSPTLQVAPFSFLRTTGAYLIQSRSRNHTYREVPHSLFPMNSNHTHRKKTDPIPIATTYHPLNGNNSQGACFKMLLWVAHKPRPRITC